MTKAEFIEQLRKKLTEIPVCGIEERLDFFSEIIDDRIEEGFSEEQAVASIGSVDEVTMQILSEVPLGKIIQKKC